MSDLKLAASDHITWFHSFRLPDGDIIRGWKSIETLESEAKIIFRDDLSGKSVLDIGAWDGYFSFEAEKRGASDVLATDHFCWSGPGWGTKAGFDTMHHRLGSSVRSHDVDVMSLTPDEFGTFDVVLLLGVLYHVTDVFRHLEAAAAMCRDHLVIETVTTLMDDPLPIARFIEPDEFGGDPTNYWIPNPALLRLMLARFGFSKVEFMLTSPPSLAKRLARRLTRPASKRRKSAPRLIVHAYR